MLYPNSSGLIAAQGGAPADPLMLGEALWRAAQITGDAEIKRAADAMLEWTLRRGPRAADGTLFHTGQTIWSDSFNTSPPFLAMAGQYDEAIKQINGHRQRLWDPRRKLLAHIWDEAAQRLTGPDAWGGGQGWAAGGIARVIRALPEERKADKQQLAGFLKDLLDGCLVHQRPDGLFHNVVDNPQSFVETNLAQMLAYSIYESIHGGWLDAGLLPAADKMRAAARAKVDKYGFVQGVCGAPNFSAPGISPEGQAFFLMMEAAAIKAERAA